MYRRRKLGVMILLLPAILLVWTGVAGAWVDPEPLAGPGLGGGKGDTDPDDFPIVAPDWHEVVSGVEEGRSIALPPSVRLALFLARFIVI